MSDELKLKIIQELAKNGLKIKNFVMDAILSIICMYFTITTKYSIMLLKSIEWMFLIS